MDQPAGYVPTREACRAVTEQIPLGNGAALVFGDRGHPGVDVTLPVELFDSMRPAP